MMVAIIRPLDGSMRLRQSINCKSLILGIALSLVLTVVVAVEEASCSTGGDCTIQSPGSGFDSNGLFPELVSWGEPNCVDLDEQECSMRAFRQDCAKKPHLILRKCPYSCALCNNHKGNRVRTCYGEEQVVNNARTMEVIRQMQNYMIHTVYADQKYEKVRAECKNYNKDCAYWASQGECEKNPRYLKIKCAPACQSCEMIDYDTRCPFDKEKAKEVTVWTEPGDLDRFFWRIFGNETYRQQYHTTVLSGPVDALKQQYGSSDDTDFQDGPWVIQLEDFLSHAECDRIIELGHGMVFKRSQDIGRKLPDGTYDSLISEKRTSTTAWCSKDSVCDLDPVTKAVTARIESLVQIPVNHFEHFQLLRYEVGQKYVVHHDWSETQSGRPSGVRILTVYFYLNDEGLKGGGTNFPMLNITIQPKKGRVVIWPSVRNDKPGERDPRTEHQAFPVEEGVKYGANAWIHERDFRSPFYAGCAN